MPNWRVIQSRVGTRCYLLVLTFFLSGSCIIFSHGAAAPGIKTIDPHNPRLLAMYGQSSKQGSASPKKAAAKSTSTMLSAEAQLALIKPRGIAPVRTGLVNSSNPILRKMAEYEKVYGGAVESHAMLFTDIPSNPSRAAVDMASTLKEFAKFGIQPVVIMEPTINGSPVNFQAYSQGTYDATLSAYFQALKGQGLQSSDLGIWTYFPEANLPEWGATNPGVFAGNVSRSVTIQKQYFPGSQASIMLDGQSYPAGSTDWGNGSYVSLLPYVQGIPKGLIDSFGYQGFPWAPPNGVNQATSYNPGQYLNTAIATEAAKQLGTNRIWLNTGSFGRMYAQSAAQTVTLGPVQRQTILTSVIAQAKSLQNAGFNTAVNLFSEDKSSSGEGTDWSYWQSGASASSPATPVFIDFANQTIDNHIDLWLFDSF